MAEKTRKAEQPKQPEEQPEVEIQETKEVSHETKSQPKAKEVSHETKEEEFNATDYIKSLEPEKKEVDLQTQNKQLKQENDLLKKQRDALKNAYLKQKQAGITIIDNGQNLSTNKKSVDEMLDKYLR